MLEDAGFDLLLVNSRHVKILPGRKTDVGDAAWLAELLEHGLLRGSFIPPDQVRKMRDVTRYRKKLIRTHTAECQRIQKNLEDAGIKLDSVASDVLGVSGRLMLRALLAGERDPEILAELAKGTLRKKIPELQRSLRGRFGEHNAMLISIILDHIEHLETAIGVLDTQLDTMFAVSDDTSNVDTQTGEVIAPFVVARDRLDTIPGVGKRVAETIIAEIGTDMTRFPTAGHLA